VFYGVKTGDIPMSMVILGSQTACLPQKNRSSTRERVQIEFGSVLRMEQQAGVYPNGLERRYHAA
jgi:hypothetical protein